MIHDVPSPPPSSSHPQQAIIEHGAYPSPLNYAGFPKSICTSVNEVIIHGIPDDRPLADGDILKVQGRAFDKQTLLRRLIFFSM
jgi:hypothetical protein